MELVQYIFTTPDVKSFLSSRICKGLLERFFLAANDNVVVVMITQALKELMKNTQDPRVVNGLVAPVNCRGGELYDNIEKGAESLPKCCRLTQ